MKPIYSTCIMLVFTLISLLGFAQESTVSKNTFFSLQPDTVYIHSGLFESIMNVKTGSTISIKFTDNIIFDGIVLSNEQAYQNQQTVLIKSSEANNALFQLSKIVTTENKELFVGRLLNTETENGYLISKNVANNYQLNKISLKNILQDCSY